MDTSFEQRPVIITTIDCEESERSASSLLSLSRHSLSSLYPSVSAFQGALTIVREELCSVGGLVKDVSAVLDDYGSKSVAAHVRLTLARASYSAGVSVNQAGRPSVEGSFFYPVFSRYPFALTGSVSRAWDGSHAVEGMATGRLKSWDLMGKLYLKSFDFSNSSGFGEERAGIEARISRGEHAVSVVAENREILPCSARKSNSLDVVLSSRLRSIRTFAAYEYRRDVVRRFRDSGLPAGGWQGKLRAEIPLDSDNFVCRILGGFDTFLRFKTTKRIVAFSSLRMGVVNAGEDVVSFSDKFFPGGSQDSFLSVLGYAPRSIHPQEGGIGSLGFAAIRGGLTFDLPGLPGSGVRGICFTQCAVAEDHIRLSSDVFRFSMGLGVIIPAGDRGAFTLSFAQPFGAIGKEDQQRFQLGFSVTKEV